MILRAASLAHAVEMARALQADGSCDAFRGQTRNWPVLSSLGRRDEAGRQEAVDRLAAFSGWLASVPQLAAVAADPDATLAVAQHYGIPTNFVDFTTDPLVAAFFAVHQPPPAAGPDETACIVCLDTAELVDFMDSVRRVRPHMPDVGPLHLDVPELWRIRSQRGIFLFFPFDEGFERHLFGFDRILFPAATPGTAGAPIPEEDVYPTQKSELEVLLDQYFMLERMRQGEKAVRAMFPAGPITFRAPADGYDAEVFGPAGLPEHGSWHADRLRDWQAPAPEDWVPITTAPVVRLEWSGDDDGPDRRARLADQLRRALAAAPGCRGGPVRWEHVGLADGVRPDEVSAPMSLLWDGLRRWPYSDHDLAEGLALAAVFARLTSVHPSSHHDGRLADRLAARALGVPRAVAVEMGMADSSYSRGHAEPDALGAAVRADFLDLLDDGWRDEVDSIWGILQVAQACRRVFDFPLLASVFARQIAATQVVLRGAATGKARLYNPARAVSLGLP